MLKRPLRGKETSPISGMETGHSVCAGQHSSIESKMVAPSWGEQERILTQERKGVGLPYQHLQALAWLVEGLQAVEVGVLVEDKLESHVCADTGFSHPSSICSFPLQLLHQARELPLSFLT